MPTGRDEFDQFWGRYPRRIAKFAAQRAYAKARIVATAEEILAGVELYRVNKPDYADFAHPATWLNQGRWMDEYEAAKAAPERCQHDPRCGSPEWHKVVLARERGEVA